MCVFMRKFQRFICNIYNGSSGGGVCIQCNPCHSFSSSSELLSTPYSSFPWLWIL